MMVTAVSNPDGSVAVVVFNPTGQEKNFAIELSGQSAQLSISKQAIQTIVIKP